MEGKPRKGSSFSGQQISAEYLSSWELESRMCRVHKHRALAASFPSCPVGHELWCHKFGMFLLSLPYHNWTQEGISRCWNGLWSIW